MRRLDSRLIHDGEDSGTLSMTYRPIFFVKKLVGQLTVLNQELKQWRGLWAVRGVLHSLRRTSAPFRPRPRSQVPITVIMLIAQDRRKSLKWYHSG